MDLILYYYTACTNAIPCSQAFAALALILHLTISSMYSSPSAKLESCNPLLNILPSKILPRQTLHIPLL